ncbi:uncharacterized protein ASCRUDRAFT_75271 [Ascoidea rubescens DSM 1968]|uniref:Uncharacterized protein n=1 Tax=Ascoidea rubescens DSM 1968 TaxID=1344418 RepID=A0A1D2VKC4_9ASCO|nr:hypothetical protein ASCRUDRAFT_75271 [Ascoidea rubescens DSM 1968]ODV62049.1 hypothetical protein ASCRUDRAFT_75271 [Ascoidea rubescens DSM 1968]
MIFLANLDVESLLQDFVCSLDPPVISVQTMVIISNFKEILIIKSIFSPKDVWFRSGYWFLLKRSFPAPKFN